MSHFSQSGEESSTVCLTIFMFRGNPDIWFNRHVLLYFTSPDDPDFHETVHVQRENKVDSWTVDQVHGQVAWELSAKYLSHINAGAVRVHRGGERVPVDIVAAIPVRGRETQSDWNCQHFILEGLQAIVSYGYQTQEWYDWAECMMMDRILEDAVG